MARFSLKQLKLFSNWPKLKSYEKDKISSFSFVDVIYLATYT
jgi:hypothetical protein